MLILFAAAAAATSANTQEMATCPGKYVVSARANHLSDLPVEVRANLASLMPDIVDAGQHLQKTDTAKLGDKAGPFHRFFGATLISNEWFVSVETGAPYAMRTIGYRRSGNSPIFGIWPSHLFGGPPCEAIQAALNGVTSFQLSE